MFWWNNCRRKRKMAVPKPTRTPTGSVAGKTSFHSATRKCESGSTADRGIFKPPLWPGQKWRGSPNCCPQQRRSGTDHPGTVVSDAVCSGEHGEVIRVRCGIASVRVGEVANQGPGCESRRRPRVSSSDECVSEVENPRPSRIPPGNEAVEFDLTGGDSDDEPLVPPTIGAVPPFPTWVDDSCQTPESQPSTPFVRVGV